MEDPKPKITFTLVKSKAKAVASHKNIPSLNVQDQSAQPPLQSTQVRDGSTHCLIEVISPNFNPSYEELGYDIWNSSEDEIIDTASSVEDQVPLKILIIDQCKKFEKKVCSVLRDKDWS